VSAGESWRRRGVEVVSERRKSEGRKAARRARNRCRAVKGDCSSVHSVTVGLGRGGGRAGTEDGGSS